MLNSSTKRTLSNLFLTIIALKFSGASAYVDQSLLRENDLMDNPLNSLGNDYGDIRLTHKPSQKPTHRPTHIPTQEPTQRPIHSPTQRPHHMPTPTPTHVPTSAPTRTQHPTTEPSHIPTRAPSPQQNSSDDDKPFPGVHRDAQGPLVFLSFVSSMIVCFCCLTMGNHPHTNAEMRANAERRRVNNRNRTENVEHEGDIEITTLPGNSGDLEEGENEQDNTEITSNAIPGSSGGFDIGASEQDNIEITSNDIAANSGEPETKINQSSADTLDDKKPPIQTV